MVNKMSLKKRCPLIPHNSRPEFIFPHYSILFAPLWVHLYDLFAWNKDTTLILRRTHIYNIVSTIAHYIGHLHLSLTPVPRKWCFWTSASTSCVMSLVMSKLFQVKFSGGAWPAAVEHLSLLEVISMPISPWPLIFISICLFSAGKLSHWRKSRLPYFSC